MFRVQPSGKDYVVTVEQAGPDVVIRVNGMGVITCQANADPVPPQLVVYTQAATELGIETVVEP